MCCRVSKLVSPNSPIFYIPKLTYLTQPMFNIPKLPHPYSLFYRFGVCCLFIYTSTGSTVNQNCSYIQSPNFPSTFTASDATSLTYTIQKCSNDVCAVRLDFETFSTVRDTVATALESNTCADPFTITSTSQGTSGQICGENAGQHIYWDLGRDSTATATIRCVECVFLSKIE